MNDELAKKLWEYVNARRGSMLVSECLLGWLQEEGELLARRTRMEIWLKTFAAGHSRAGGEYLTSKEVAMFMANLGIGTGLQSVLDPACGTGLLLAQAAEALSATVVHGVDANLNVIDIAKLLLPSAAQVIHGNTLRGSLPLHDEYDLIVSEPPFNCQLKEPYFISTEWEGLNDVSHAILCWSATKLSRHGRAVYLLPANCLNVRGDRLWKNLTAVDVHVRALIHVPAGHLKAAAIDSYIAVVERTARDQLFTAQYGADEGLQRQILKNFALHQAGKRPAQGRLVDYRSFQGFRVLEALEHLSETARRQGLRSVPMQKLVVGHELIKAVEATSNDTANDLYLPMTGRCEAVLHPAQLTAKKMKVARLVIDGELADARFVAASLNSEIGRLFIASVCPAAGAVKQVSLEMLLNGTFYLPSIQVQNQALEAMSRVHALRASLDEIESGLWAHPTQIEKQIQQLRRVNHEDTLEAWLEGLPFPLASILWRYRASNGSTKDKNEILLQFFEAVAEFWATIYLSAARSDREFWADHVTPLAETVKRGKLSFELATFGLWKCVTEFLSSKFRKLINEDMDRCTAMFRTASRDVLDMLFDRRLLTVLQTANSIRNNRYHGGVTSARDTEIVHAQLSDLIQTCRSVMGTVWERYELIQPGECRFASGQFGYKVRSVMGTRTPFTTVERKTIEAMDDGVLHLLDPDGERALRLLAFVRVIPSPKTEANACYFYNRKQATNQKFVSYHFEADAEVEEFCADTLAALDGMLPFGSPGPHSEAGKA